MRSQGAEAARNDARSLAEMIARPSPYVEIVETHTATLYFADDRVCKRKKPVDLGFLDFSSRQAQAVACEAEVALNRRLAPDVYLGVAAQGGDASDATGEIREAMAARADPWPSAVVIRTAVPIGEAAQAARSQPN